ncbi:hypothetical protein [Formosa algae]|uniref:Outer membrane protein beta-barrel domain-containing protein n=1 Tax=Formosa algae TaxID=225843 RepID=A0A9X1CAE8_9FLAO|nr:hypothetical protein [Formosa algae]MBP1838892.1 hypothetical protein [Formosa algae]MDQ0333669.1 hypothetical protein [Formosa algae]
MKHKKLNLFILIVLLGHSLYSQDKYNSGYVLTTKKDTINGFILNKIDSELAYKISFKRNLLDETNIEYTPNELLSFSFSSGRVFERKKIMNDNKTSKDSLYIFAKRIVKGKIDLFVWRHEKYNSKDFFIINNNSKREAQLIKPKKNKIKLDGKSYSKKDSKYKNYISYVKKDENLEAENNNNLSFGEKSISKDIISFNRNFQDEYPIEIYKEPFEYNYDILGGIPLSLKSEELHFRIGVYRNKTFIEKSNKFSYLNGIVYHHWSDKDKNWNKQYPNGTSNYRWQMLNIIPVGIKFQTNPKNIILYGYIGAGAAVLMMTDYIIEDYENVGSQKDFLFLPTVNVGLGAKIKVNSNFILTELTPTMNGVFFNVGYSF